MPHASLAARSEILPPTSRVVGPLRCRAVDEWKSYPRVPIGTCTRPEPVFGTMGEWINGT